MYIMSDERLDERQKSYQLRRILVWERNLGKSEAQEILEDGENINTLEHKGVARCPKGFNGLF